ncbi:MAG: hypothetical protein HY422_02385 [Candidatus Komeilibacteria bacterium]|nr:hypothetical protein [Candidatus Komeilibacteria bacterium]
MHWIIAAFFVPVPLFHVWLHALLPAWRRAPVLIYVFFVAAWAGAAAILPVVDRVSPIAFVPSAGLQLISSVFMLIGLSMVCLSLITLGPVRFFVLSVLKPEGAPATRVTSGIFRFVSHPSYLGILMISFFNFVGSGKLYLAGIFAYFLITLPIVILFEERELAARLSSIRM